MIAGWGILSYLENVFQILIVLLRPFGIVYYKISFDKNIHYRTLNLILNETLVTTECILKGNKKVPSGYFINRNCIGYIFLEMEYMTNSVITIITTKNYYDYLICEPEEEYLEETETPTKDDISRISVYTRFGTYRDLTYSKININVKDLVPLETQVNVVNEIVKKFNEKKVVKVFIEGFQGTGKSSIGYCVAKVLSGKFTHSFNPTDPGDTFTNVISNMNYDNQDGPNVIVLEEVDILLDKIHNNKIIQNNDIPTMIKDKSSWNSFLDDMVFYKNTILILTSNTPKEKIDMLDKAYLRNGRIDLYFQMNIPIMV